jgi:hypothetical protein
MKEETAKKLIQKSTIPASEDFTDKLFLKIEEEQSKLIVSIRSVQSLRYPMLVLIVGGGVYFMVLFSGFLPKLEVFDYQFQVNKIPFLVILLFTLLLGANHVLRLRSTINNLTKS